MDDVVDFINVNRDRYVEELKQYLAIPSISALPQHAADVKRCAEWTADEMRRIGMQNVRLVDTPGYPDFIGGALAALSAVGQSARRLATGSIHLYLGYGFIVDAFWRPLAQRAWSDLLLALGITIVCMTWGYLVGVLAGGTVSSRAPRSSTDY